MDRLVAVHAQATLIILEQKLIVTAGTHGSSIRRSVLPLWFSISAVAVLILSVLLSHAIVTSHSAAAGSTDATPSATAAVASLDEVNGPESFPADSFETEAVGLGKGNVPCDDEPPACIDAGNVLTVPLVAQTTPVCLGEVAPFTMVEVSWRATIATPQTPSSASLSIIRV